MRDLRSPLSRVKGLGSAREGTGHFWHQRLTALLLIPLALWIGFCIAALPADYATLAAWVRQPLVTVALVLLIIAVFYHAQLGLQIVIEDYVASHAGRTLVLLISNLLCLLFGTVGVISVLKISFGA
ncbi:MAG: succinate dehydrogenase, hydrophobic membrane anchor protein [Gammaproteobacteria bacterium]|jgi:succinate dehydrogenase / fumarate reductase membrane anchor subunit|nr:succinate dehydrogenase, hydrophobic membrane anchor protein [Gammaproteobacteria bacterium]